jgi:hypothetical protein
MSATGAPPTKPLAKAVPESREPKSIRFTPTEWHAIRETGLRHGEDEPARYVRKLTMYALSIVQAQDAAEASLGIPRARMA